MVTDPDDLRDRVVGKRFYDTANDEALTVIELEGQLLVVQYDDGIAWDEQASPEILSEGVQVMLGVSEGGIDDERYIPLGAGPRLSEACDEDEHVWSPTPTDLGWDDLDLWYSTPKETALCTLYSRFVRCTKCGLSGNALATFRGQRLPTICDRCADELLPGTDELVFEPTMEWGDSTLCADCAEDEQERSNQFPILCYDCGKGFDSDEEPQSIPGSSMMGSHLGVDDETGYLCQGCFSDVRDEMI